MAQLTICSNFAVTDGPNGLRARPAEITKRKEVLVQVRGNVAFAIRSDLSEFRRGFAMNFVRRDAIRDDLPRIVEIYNCAVLTRESTCDLRPISIDDRLRWFETHSGSNRPIWVAEDSDDQERGVVGYAGFYHFMNDRPGYYITSDLAIYLHPDYQGKRLGTYLLREAISHAPTLGIEVLAVTIFASNLPSIRLFERHGFERWGFMPRVARLGDIERDLVMMGRRVSA